MTNITLRLHSIKTRDPEARKARSRFTGCPLEIEDYPEFIGTPIDIKPYLKRRLKGMIEEKIKLPPYGCFIYYHIMRDGKEIVSGYKNTILVGKIGLKEGDVLQVTYEY